MPEIPRPSALFPPASAAVMRLLQSRWDRYGQCEAMNPDGKAKLRCCECADHKDKHWSVMGVSW